MIKMFEENVCVRESNLKKMFDKMYKVCKYYLVAFLNWTPIFDWYVVQ